MVKALPCVKQVNSQLEECFWKYISWIFSYNWNLTTFTYGLCHLFTKKQKFNIKVSLQGVADVRQKVGVVLEVECELLCRSMKIIWPHMALFELDTAMDRVAFQAGIQRDKL